MLNARLWSATSSSAMSSSEGLFLRSLLEVLDLRTGWLPGWFEVLLARSREESDLHWRNRSGETRMAPGL